MIWLPLTVDGCEVRSWRSDDAEALARHANNRKIWLNMRDVFPYPYSLEDALRYIDMIVGQSPELSYCIACEDRAIGGIGLKPNTDVERFSAEIGYWLGEGFWGRGIATAAVLAVTRHGVATLGFNRVFALPYARNAPSCRLLEKAGYLLEGRMIRSAFKDGRWEDQFLYAWVKPALRGDCRDANLE